MKQFKATFKIVLAVLTLCFLPPKAMLSASPSDTTAISQMEDVRISLLTCGPGNEVWSLYGHTAIRYQDFRTGQDIAINYGIFSFNQPYFILRFVFGITDYEMGIAPMDLFIQEYQQENRWVLQQDLNLTNEEKLSISRALYENSLPQNRVYRYNYFYDNCTTRARNILLKNMNKIKDTPHHKTIAPSYRSMIRQWNGQHRWARFGNDLLLGVKADFLTTYQEREFLPDSLRKDFDNMILLSADGTKRKLVSKSFYLIPPTTAPSNATSSHTYTTHCTPANIFAVLLLLVLVLTYLIQWKQKRSLWVLDSLLLLVSGLAGLVLLAMIFSQHPTVSLNLQILMLNPLSLLFLYPTLKMARKGRAHWYWKMLLGCVILFLLGGFIQDYAEGMYFLALCLLIRCVANIYHPCK